MILGTVQMVLGIGGVVGGLVVTAWGGFKRRIHGILLGLILISIPGQIIIGLGRGIQVWAVGAFLVDALHAAGQRLQPGDLAGESPA